MESVILGFWNPQYHSRNPESHQRLESRIQVPLTKTGIQYLESGIQDCLEFPYMGMGLYCLEIFEAIWRMQRRFLFYFVSSSCSPLLRQKMRFMEVEEKENDRAYIRRDNFNHIQLIFCYQDAVQRGYRSCIK